MVTVSTAWAWYIFLVWAVMASIGLARVALATIQLRRMRAEAVAVDLKTLDADLRALMEEFQRYSDSVCCWCHNGWKCRQLLASTSRRSFCRRGCWSPRLPEELKYILLHELAHLRRRDDWTNLAQKVLKALLFFLPSVWWIERRLSLDREMACDDAVLAHSGSLAVMPSVWRRWRKEVFCAGKLLWPRPQWAAYGN